jgi:predicted ferric reductase
MIKFDEIGELRVNELRAGMYFKKKYTNVGSVIVLVVNKLMRTGFESNYSISVKVMESNNEDFLFVGKKMFMEFKLQSGQFPLVEVFEGKEVSKYNHLFKGKSKQ